MPKVTIIFHKCIQDSQDFESDDEHMMSQVFFRIEVDGNSSPDMYCDLKQTVGSNFEPGPIIEVGNPQGATYSGPFNYAEYRNAVERYYRSCVGSSGTGIKIGAGAKNIRMRHNTFNREERVQFNWT